MDVILQWLLAGIGIATLVGGIYIYGYLVHPIVVGINASLKSGVWPTKEQQKDQLRGLAIGIGSILAVPTLLMAVILVSIQINIPIMYDIGHELNNLFVGVVDVIVDEDYTYDTNTGTVDGGSGGGAPSTQQTPYPTPMIPPPQPTQPPQVIVVTATPQYIQPTQAPTLP